MGRQGTPINYRWGGTKESGRPPIKVQRSEAQNGPKGMTINDLGGGRTRGNRKKISETFLKEKKEDGH